MGWLKPKPNPTQDVDATPTKQSSLKPSAIHIEAVDEPDAKDSVRANETQPPTPPFPFASATTPNAHLPFIPASRIAAESGDGGGGGGRYGSDEGKGNGSRLWIVVDDVVYDCTDFARSEHPGGAAVVENLAGGDCSWQFWRFHSAEHLRGMGWGLRVGRTAGVRNRFGGERARYVGLGGLDAVQDW